MLYALYQSALLASHPPSHPFSYPSRPDSPVDPLLLDDDATYEEHERQREMPRGFRQLEHLHAEPEPLPAYTRRMSPVHVYAQPVDLSTMQSRSAHRSSTTSTPMMRERPVSTSTRPDYEKTQQAWLDDVSRSLLSFRFSHNLTHPDLQSTAVPLQTPQQALKTKQVPLRTKQSNRQARGKTLQESQSSPTSTRPMVETRRRYSTTRERRT